MATWSWADFGALPQTESVVDIHCVTRWTKFDTRWRGVSFDDLLRAAGLEQPPTMFVMAHCDGGYTTNLPIADLIDGKAMVATHLIGCRCEPSMADRLVSWCRISTSGRAPNGCAA